MEIVLRILVLNLHGASLLRLQVGRHIRYGRSRNDPALKVRHRLNPLAHLINGDVENIVLIVQLKIEKLSPDLFINLIDNIRPVIKLRKGIFFILLVDSVKISFGSPCRLLLSSDLFNPFNFLVF